jgi:hypothetical protein
MKLIAKKCFPKAIQVTDLPRTKPCQEVTEKLD